MFARELLAPSVARHIQGMILSGELAIGRRIPGQREFAEQLGISRASLREALLTLETLGLVRTEPGRGTFVSPRSANGSLSKWRYADTYRLEEVFQTRLTIESRIAELCAQVILPDDLARLSAATERMESAYAAGDLLANVDADLEFHGLIAGRCPNRMLVDVYLSVREQLTETQRLPIPNTAPARMSQSISEHRAMITAFTDRDPVRAGESMRAHIRNTAACAGIALD